MKIAVVGPGALGCLFAAYLGRLNEVWLLDHDPDRARMINDRGLVLDESGQSQNVHVTVTGDVSTLPEVEILLLCVKSSSVKDAVLSSLPVIENGKPLLIALQNGIGHLDVLPKLLTCPWGLGVTAQGATLAGPGQVMHRGEGPTRIGYSEGVIQATDAEARLVRAASVLTESGIPTETSGDIQVHIWNKLLVNVGINALTAINDCPNGMLLESQVIMKIMKDAVLEAESVAKLLGIKIDPDPLAKVIEVCRATAANISSMLQDVRKKRKTEIDAINGAIVRKGHELGVSVPANEELVRKVREIEKGFY